VRSAGGGRLFTRRYPRRRQGFAPCQACRASPECGRRLIRGRIVGSTNASAPWRAQERFASTGGSASRTPTSASWASDEASGLAVSRTLLGAAHDETHGAEDGVAESGEEEQRRAGRGDDDGGPDEEGARVLDAVARRLDDAPARADAA